MKRILSALAVLLLAAPIFAQTWTAPYVIDTGWHQPNQGPCEPLANEPQLWATVQIPLAPDGTDLVRTRGLTTEYHTVIECTNNSNQPVRVWGNATILSWLGHAPGLFTVYGNVYAAGHGFDTTFGYNALAGSVSMGGGGFERVLAPGQTAYITAFTPPSAQTYVSLEPISEKWLTVNRRGAHPMFVTPEGGYSWNWAWVGTPPSGWSHSPVSYSMETGCRERFSIEYGSF